MDLVLQLLVGVISEQCFELLMRRLLIVFEIIIQIL
jgi:hypothetical protein